MLMRIEYGDFCPTCQRHHRHGHHQPGRKGNKIAWPATARPVRAIDICLTEAVRPLFGQSVRGPTEFDYWLGVDLTAPWSVGSCGHSPPPVLPLSIQRIPR